MGDKGPVQEKRTSGAGLALLAAAAAAATVAFTMPRTNAATLELERVDVQPIAHSASIEAVAVTARAGN